MLTLILLLIPLVAAVIVASAGNNNAAKKVNKNKKSEIKNNRFSDKGYINNVFSKNVKLPVIVKKPATNKTRLTCDIFLVNNCIYS